MTESKAKKVPLEGFIRLPKDLDRMIEKEAFKLDLFKYEVVDRMWVAYEALHSGEKDSSGTPTKVALPSAEGVGVKSSNVSKGGSISEAIALVSQSLEALRDIQESSGGIQGQGRKPGKVAGGRRGGNRGGPGGRGKDRG